MENEYSHLEHLVNDVTNLDTARMTLRWALERLHALEKSNAELKRDFAAAQAAREQAEQKAGSIQQSMESRAKALGEQEGFHKKMEATLELLSSGKIDVAHFVRKEAQLDSLRLELEEDYQRRFENLDKTQAQISQRWNQRLLDVESRYAERLSESQKRYDSLRQGLEKEHQARLAMLEGSFRDREKELLERIDTFEEIAKLHDNAVEERRTVLESELSAKKTGVEHNYQKLKTALETNFDARVRTMEGEHAKRMKSLEATWEAERNRLIEEQRSRENQFRTAQDRIKELEESLARQQASHHAELIERVREGESAFREKVNQLEEGRSVQEKELSRRSLELEESAEKKLAGLEADFSGRKAELDAQYQKSRQEMNLEFKNKMAAQEKAWKSEKSRLEAGFSGARKDFEAAQAELAEMAVKIKQLEKGLIDKDSAQHVEILELNQRHEQAMQERMTEMTRRDAAWAEKLRKIEHDVIWKKVAELDSKYQERRIELENKTRAIQAEFESDLAARRAELETEYARRQKLYEESRQAEKSRFESEIADSRKVFESAQAELAGAMARIQELEENLVEKDAEHDRRVLELKRRHEAVLKDRVREEVDANVSEVNKDLELMTARMEELGRIVREKENLINGLKNEISARDSEWSEKLRNFEHNIISGKVQKLEEEYHKHRIELEIQAQKEQAQMKKDLENLRNKSGTDT